MPITALITIQNTAPAPPAESAVATPTMLPVPMHAARAAVRACRCDIEPSDDCRALLLKMLPRVALIQVRMWVS